MSLLEKYLRYKKKYFILKNQFGLGIGDVKNYIDKDNIIFVYDSSKFLEEEYTPNLFLNINGVPSTEIINSQVFMTIGNSFRILISRTGTVYLTKDKITNYQNIPIITDQIITDLKSKIKNREEYGGVLDFIKGGNIYDFSNIDYTIEDNDTETDYKKVDDTKVKKLILPDKRILEVYCYSLKYYNNFDIFINKNTGSVYIHKKSIEKLKKCIKMNQ